MQIRNYIALYLFVAIAISALCGLLKWLYYRHGPTKRSAHSVAHKFRPW